MTAVEDFLEHYGIKGQKWGVRRAAKKAAKEDKKWQNNIYSIRGAVEVHNASARRFNDRIDALNAQPRFRNSHLDHPERPETRSYIQAVESMSERCTREAVDEVHGVSPSGTLRARYDMREQRVVVESTDIQHKDDVLPTMVYEVNIDNLGRISSFRFVNEDYLRQSDITDFLEHYGVKGQKWGVRRRSMPRGRSGSSKPRAQDLSDEDLRSAINRMNMEQQYSRLVSGRRRNSNTTGRLLAAGAAFVASIGANVARTQIQNQANNRIAAELAARAARRAAG